MDFGLKGEVALVGGASQGIGFAIARMLANEGAKVAMVARQQARLDEAMSRVAAESGTEAIAVQGDIRRPEDCERMVDATVAHYGRLDVLVNNDGAPPLGHMLEFDDTAWEKAVQQNLMSVVRLTRRAIPHMRAQGRGRIVNITALSALQPIARFGLSVSTWAGVIGYAKTLSLEVAANQITVNTICPGRSATGRLAKVFGSGESGEEADRKLREDMAKQIPMGRVGTLDEVAGLVAFLASAFGGYITGATIQVDGGRRASVL